MFVSLGTHFMHSAYKAAENLQKGSYFINVLLIITHICANITLCVLSKFHEELPSNSKPADSDSRPTYHQQSSDLIRYVNMTTLLSRTTSSYNASVLQYSPGNDLQVDPETDCLEGPAMVEQATVLLVQRLTHCHRLCACVVDHNFLS